VRGVDFYSARQFRVFRILLGILLVYRVLVLLPYAGETFSAEGMRSAIEVPQGLRFFPNVLDFFDSALSVQIFLLVLLGAAFAFTLGKCRRTAAILLWYGFACLYNQNPLIQNVSLGYLGWLLLACAVIPSGEASAGPKQAQRVEWQMPSCLYWGAWLILSLGYTVSGFAKLSGDMSWIRGDVFTLVAERFVTNSGVLAQFFFELPLAVQRVVCWFVVGVQAAFFPCALWGPSRAVVWTAMLLMHIGVIVTFPIPEISCTILLFHLFVFDARWLNSLVRG